MTSLWIVLVGLSLAISFLMSGMETGVFALSRLRVRRLVRAGNRRAAVLQKYLDDPEDFLWTILVGNTLTNLTVVILLVLGFQDVLRDSPILFWWFFAAGGLVFYAVLELLPKMLFRLYPTRLCLLLSQPFRLIHFFLQPVVWVMARFSEWVRRWFGDASFTGRMFGSREELKMVLEESSAALSKEERRMIGQVINLQSAFVTQVMVAWERVVRVKAEAHASEVWELARESGFSRLPVFQERATGRGKILGVISVMESLYAEARESRRKAQDLARPALFVPQEMRVEAALQLMQRRGQHLAVIVRRDGEPLGIITTRDILAGVFGDVVL